MSRRGFLRGVFASVGSALMPWHARAPDLFIARFTPADYLQTVEEMLARINAKAALLPKQELGEVFDFGGYTWRRG